jgi:hypothetical protein
MFGANTTVTVEHLATTRDSHGGKQEGAADQTFANVDATIVRSSAGNLWRIMLAGNFSAISQGPDEWRVTDAAGRVFGPQRATYRAPVEQIGESESTLVFAELHGESGEAVVT